MDFFNLKDYIIHFEKVIPSNLCKTIVKDCESLSWQLIPWTDYSNNQLKNVDVGNPRHAERPVGMPAKFRMSLHPIIESQITHYMRNKFATFNISGFSPISLNRYTKGSSCLRHVDHIHSLFDGQKKGIPTLSVVGVLNDDYEGGEFIFWDDYQVPLKEGSIIIFPSNFLYSHRVNTITKGTRFSFVSWVW